jgi:hypothetical protein
MAEFRIVPKRKRPGPRTLIILLMAILMICLLVSMAILVAK